jgi:RNA ligase (TIGR02306 family)
MSDPMLVYSGKISAIYPIEKADFLESAEVICGMAGKWRGTVKKGEYKIGDIAAVFLPDTIVPHTLEFEFMEKYNWRVRAQRFRGAPSEVVIMPCGQAFLPGVDLSVFFPGVEKYYKPIPIALSGEIYGDFPQFIPKTDEPNFQSVPHMVEWFKGKRFYSTIKVDGSSGTFYYRNGHFGVCSRNIELKESEHNVFWSLARKHDLEKILGKMINPTSIQGEVAGPGIQGNPLGLKEPSLFIFNGFDIQEGYWNVSFLCNWCESFGLPMVNFVDYNGEFNFPDDETLRHYAERKYPNGKQAEGVVIRTMDETRRLPTGERASFKILNLLYKECGD